MDYDIITVSILWYLKVLIFLQILFIFRGKAYIYILFFISIFIRLDIILDLKLGNDLISSIPFFVLGMIISQLHKGYKNPLIGFFLITFGTLLIYYNSFAHFSKMSLYTLVCSGLLFMGVLLMKEDVFANKSWYKYSFWLFLSQMLLLLTIRHGEIFQKIYEEFNNFVFIYEVILIIVVILILIVLRNIIGKIPIVNNVLVRYGI